MILTMKLMDVGDIKKTSFGWKMAFHIIHQNTKEHRNQEQP